MYLARGELMMVGQVWVLESLGVNDCHTGRWIPARAAVRRGHLDPRCNRWQRIRDSLCWL